MLSNNRFQEDLLSAGTVIQSEMGGRVTGGGPARGVCTHGGRVCGENRRPGAAHTGGLGRNLGDAPVCLGRAGRMAEGGVESRVRVASPKENGGRRAPSACLRGG